MNNQDYKEIDIALQKCIDRGYMARLTGKSKYENEFEPGSLSFDAWRCGYELPDLTPDILGMGITD